jgi:hypothetical protein
MKRCTCTVAARVWPSFAIVIATATATACAEPSADDELGDGGPAYAPVDGVCDDVEAATDPYVDCVEAFEPAEGVSFGHDAMPEIVLGPPQGAGERAGGTHVASLGCGGSITLYFAAPWPIDGPGEDFIVFENAFRAGETDFVEPAQVLVSEDGERWHAFACEPDGEPEPPPGCAGLRPVLATGPGAPLDPASAGGDAFDLAELGLSHARYVRIVDRTALHHGSQTWCLGATGGFDLDAIAVAEAAP